MTFYSGLMVTQDHLKWYYSKALVKFLILIPWKLSCIVLETTAEIEIVFIPLAFDGPVRGSLSEYCHTIWCGKARMVRLRDGENV